MYGGNQSIGNGSEAMYSAWKTEAERIANLKTEYESLLRNPDFSNTEYRRRIINLAKILINNVSDIIGEDDYKSLSKIIQTMQSTDNNIQIFATSSTGMSRMNMQLVLLNNASSFEYVAHEFMKRCNAVFQTHKLGMKTKKAESEIRKMYKIFDVENRFKNSSGVPISAEIETLARICSCRVNEEWDNFFVIEGETGVGKSMFAYGLGTTIAEKVGMPFDVEHHIIFNESKEYVTQRIKQAQHGDVIILDEGGNQANTKTWWEKDQVAFMNILNLVRFHNLTLLVNWTHAKNLDKTLRERIHGIISIKKRGHAILRTFNKNPYVTDKVYNPQSAKVRIAKTSEEAEDLVKVYDPTLLMIIPFYKVPDNLWEKYKIRKEKAMSMATLGKKINGSTQLLASDYYNIFLLEFPVDKFEITSKELEVYSKKNSFALSMKKLALALAKATNRRVDQIFTNTNPAEAFEGYITKDEYISGYIEKLRAQKIGSQNKEKELNEGGESNDSI